MTKPRLRAKGDATRLSLDVTLAEKKTYAAEAQGHGLSLRGYFFHCWRTSQKMERDT